jgi:hypothetical protein
MLGEDPLSTSLRNLAIHDHGYELRHYVVGNMTPYGGHRNPPEVRHGAAANTNQQRFLPKHSRTLHG